jgi:quercetin dioxygenase-like cupin family protein
MMGILIGRLGIPTSFWPSSVLTTTLSFPNPNHIESFIKHIQDVPIRNTAHIDQDGQPITKQQFLDPFLIPNVAGFSVATIQPGQTVSLHSHKTMHEFFYVIDGSGKFIFDGKTQVVSPGSFIHIVPPTEHEIVVPSENGESLKVLLAGILVE